MPELAHLMPDYVSPRILKLKNRLEPGGGNYHFDEWDHHYLGVSTLIKRSAAEYAKKVITQDRGGPQNGYSGFKGNALADAALADVEHNEAHLVIPDFVRGWSLEGHCDGLGIDEPELIDGEPVFGITPYEGKSHDYDGPKDWMLARRQNTTYAAMLDLLLQQGQRTFQQARWTWPSPDTPVTFTLPQGRCRVSHSVCFFMPAHSRGEPRYIEDELTAESKAAALEWVRAKFDAILTSVEYAWANYGKGTPLDANQLHAALSCRGGAYDWDRGVNGLREFEPPEDPNNPPPTPWHQFPDLDWSAIERELFEFEQAKNVKNDADRIRAKKQADALAFLAAMHEDPDERPTKLVSPNGIAITVAGGWNGKKSPHLKVKLPNQPEGTDGDGDD